MKLDLTGLHIEITDAIRKFAEKKVQKLGRFFDNETIAHVTYSAKKDKQKVDIRIEYKSKTYIAEVETHDVYAGIDQIIDKIAGQIRKEKTIKEKKRREVPVDMSINIEEEE